MVPQGLGKCAKLTLELTLEGRARRRRFLTASAPSIPPSSEPYALPPQVQHVTRGQLPAFLKSIDSQKLTGFLQVRS